MVILVVCTLCIFKWFYYSLIHNAVKKVTRLREHETQKMFLKMFWSFSSIHLQLMRLGVQKCKINSYINFPYEARAIFQNPDICPNCPWYIHKLTWEKVVCTSFFESEFSINWLNTSLNDSFTKLGWSSSQVQNKLTLMKWFNHEIMDYGWSWNYDSNFGSLHKMQKVHSNRNSHIIMKYACFW